MTPEIFVRRYEDALGTQDWRAVAPLISDAARIVFSDGSVHSGKDAIKTAFERNFATIQNETYRMENIHWLVRTPETAAFMFDFSWSGLVRNQPASGAGRGMSVLVRDAGRWVLMAEQLGPRG